MIDKVLWVYFRHLVKSKKALVIQLATRLESGKEIVLKSSNCLQSSAKFKISHMLCFAILSNMTKYKRYDFIRFCSIIQFLGNLGPSIIKNEANNFVRVCMANKDHQRESTMVECRCCISIQIYELNSFFDDFLIKIWF